MADVTFTVTDWRQRRYAIQQDIAEIGARVAAAAAANSPRQTGRLAGSFTTAPGRDPGTTLIRTSVPYARYLEYGTRRVRAHAMLGRALAAGA